MKTIVSLLLVGLGAIVAQGCAVESAEDTSITQDALSSQCFTQSGAFTTKAALAVAAGIELGRWQPLDDFVVNWNGTVSLSPNAQCLRDNCANTKAILGQQAYSADMATFNNANYSSDLVASFQRNRDLLDDVGRNNRSKLPPAHKLTKVAGPTDLGIGACGSHYVFQVDHPDGTPLTPTEATNMQGTLCFYGQDATYVGRACGNNPFIGFTQTQQGCPSGRVCVAIDPDANDNGSTTTTTSGAAPTYPMNRVYNPSNSLLNTACTTTAGKAGTMLSKCSTMPTTCGYLYCTAP